VLLLLLPLLLRNVQQHLLGRVFLMVQVLLLLLLPSVLLLPRLRQMSLRIGPWEPCRC